MRFKYYLRGAGIGVILTTLIFTIAFAVYKPTLSDDEIMQKAEALGMEMPADDSDSADKKIQRQQRIKRMMPMQVTAIRMMQRHQKMAVKRMS